MASKSLAHRPLQLCTFGLAVAILLTSLGVGTAQAQGEKTATSGKDIAVVQRKPFLRKGRVELAPTFGVTVNDSLIRQFEVGGTLSYHITEFIWISGGYQHYDFGGEFGGVTDEYFEVQNRTGSIPEVVELEWAGGGDLGIVPIYGKFAMFDSAIVYYDVSLFLGGGVMQHTAGDGSTSAPYGEIGLMPRVFLNDWLSLDISVKDRVMSADLSSGSSLLHTVVVNAGLSIYVPFGFEYTTAR